MLKKYSDRICTYFLAEYEPRFGPALGKASDDLFQECSPPRVGLGAPLTYIFSWPSQRYFVLLSFSQVAWQALGLAEWRENRQRHVNTIRAALETLEVGKLKRIGFKVTAYFPLEMSHQELCDLMFGSFLASSDEWGDVWGESVDPLLRLEGERQGLKYVAAISPMNTRQSAANFRQHKNLEQFVEDKFLDTGVKDFEARLTASDCLFFDIDLSQNDVATEALDKFTQDSLTQAEQLADWCVRHLRSQPTTGAK